MNDKINIFAISKVIGKKYCSNIFLVFFWHEDCSEVVDNDIKKIKE